MILDALHLILNSDPSKISQENVYNICSGKGISVKDVINIIVENLKLDLNYSNGMQLG